ncbi:MAG: DinB family protein [Anaerolineales bacterium]|nr:DinB family protein [Anaerolineales bacterium]
MLDFEAVREKQITLTELCAGLTVNDLRGLTNEMVDRVHALISGCTDQDVIFQPVDPTADDPYAASDVEETLAWTLGHVIVHVTASSEESAFLAAEMARGVQNHGRSRYETPWENVTTLAQCRHRLEESRRLRLASLDLWPEQPHYDVQYAPWPGAGEINCVERFVLGLRHEDDHLGQIAEIVRQAQAR